MTKNLFKRIEKAIGVGGEEVINPNHWDFGKLLLLLFPHGGTPLTQQCVNQAVWGPWRGARNTLLNSTTVHTGLLR